MIYICIDILVAYRGCFSESLFSAKNIEPDYESKEFMKIGFCIQVCIGKSQDLQNSPKFIGLSVSLILNMIPQYYELQQPA